MKDTPPTPKYDLAAVEITFTMYPGYMDLIPKKEHENDVSYLLRSRLEQVIDPNQFRVIPTGVFLMLPQLLTEYDPVNKREVVASQMKGRIGSYPAHVREQQVLVLDTPHDIQPGCTEELTAFLYNAGTKPFHIKRGDVVALLSFQLAPMVDLKFVSGITFSQYPDTSHGKNGFINRDKKK